MEQTVQDVIENQGKTKEMAAFIKTDRESYVDRRKRMEEEAERL